mmetsp:Transcript_8827/g.26068  ORF Transcript_8827/g.26068 Transcript_8827/m.26068 type:complete len:483 (+) Transcript_8827:3185-4633(+)
MRRGWVTTIRGRRELGRASALLSSGASPSPSQSSRMYCGSCVLLPLPVPPLTTMTLSSASSCASGRRRLRTGSRGTPRLRFASSWGSSRPPASVLYSCGPTRQGPALRSGTDIWLRRPVARCFHQASRSFATSWSPDLVSQARLHRFVATSRGRSSSSMGVTAMRRSQVPTSPPPNSAERRVVASWQAVATARRRLRCPTTEDPRKSRRPPSWGMRPTSRQRNCPARPSPLSTCSAVSTTASLRPPTPFFSSIRISDTAVFRAAQDSWGRPASEKRWSSSFISSATGSDALTSILLRHCLAAADFAVTRLAPNAQPITGGSFCPPTPCSFTMATTKCALPSPWMVSVLSKKSGGPSTKEVSRLQRFPRSLTARWSARSLPPLVTCSASGSCRASKPGRASRTWGASLSPKTVFVRSRAFDSASDLAAAFCSARRSACSRCLCFIISAFSSRCTLLISFFASAFAERAAFGGTGTPSSSTAAA